MEENLINLDDHRPHLSVKAYDKNCYYVIPESIFTDVIAGKLKIIDVDDYELIFKTIIKEWLQYVRG